MQKPRLDKQRMILAALREKPLLAAGIDRIRAEREKMVKEARSEAIKFEKYNGMCNCRFFLANQDQEETETI